MFGSTTDKKCHWVGEVHEEVLVKGKVQKLKGHKIHNNYQTVEQFMTKLNDYTSREQKLVNPIYEFFTQIHMAQRFSGWLARFVFELFNDDLLHCCLGKIMAKEKYLLIGIFTLRLGTKTNQSWPKFLVG